MAFTESILVRIAWSLGRPLYGAWKVLRSWWRLHSTLESVRMIRFNRSRDDYRARRGSGISEYILNGRRSVMMVGINLDTGNNYEGLERSIKKLVSEDSERHKPVQVTISLLNPENDSIMKAMAQTLRRDEMQLRESIRATLNVLSSVRRDMPASRSCLLRIRTHDIIPFASAIIIDPMEPGGEIQFETKAYKMPIDKSFGFALRQGGKHALFSDLVASYEALVADGQEWEK